MTEHTNLDAIEQLSRLHGAHPKPTTDTISDAVTGYLIKLTGSKNGAVAVAGRIIENAIPDSPLARLIVLFRKADSLPAAEYDPEGAEMLDDIADEVERIAEEICADLRSSATYLACRHKD